MSTSSRVGTPSTDTSDLDELLEFADTLVQEVPELSGYSELQSSFGKEEEKKTSNDEEQKRERARERERRKNIIARRHVFESCTKHSLRLTVTA